jgi:hypothetical protein
LSEGGAQEFAPFRLTGVDGYVSMRYLKDADVTDTTAPGSAGSVRSRE